MPTALNALLLVDDRALQLPDPLRATLATALSLALRRAGPLTVPELAAARRRAPVTVRRHLRALGRQGWPLLTCQGRLWLVDASRVASRLQAPPSRDETALPNRLKTLTAAAPGRDTEQKDQQPAAMAPVKAAAAATIPDPAAAPPEPQDPEQPAREALRSAGIYPDLASDLAQRPWVTANLVRRCAAALGTRPDIRSVPAVLARVLLNREAAVALARSAPERVCQQRLREAQAHLKAHHPAAADQPLHTLWRRALARLETTWDPQAVRAYLQQATPLGAEGGVLLLAVPDVAACQWLNARARGPVLTALAGGPPRGKQAAALANALDAIKDVQFVVARNSDAASHA